LRVATFYELTGILGKVTEGDNSKDADGSQHARASIPTDSSAIIHTHPNGIDPLPSEDDYKTAKKSGKPNFVMSAGSIYVAMPNGDVKHPVKVADISYGKHGKLNIKWQ
jgi:hypothetical protein